RYGWSVNDLHEAIRQGLTHKQAKELGGGLSMIPDTDNAFVGQFPKLDLSELLLPAVDQNPERNVQWNRLINMEALNDIAKDGQIPVTSRMVFLPRTTQGYNDTEVSVLKDKPVGYHEFGHQIQASIQQANRLVNEALADLLAVGFTNDPKIGVFFAEASGV